MGCTQQKYVGSGSHRVRAVILAIPDHLVWTRLDQSANERHHPLSEHVVDEHGRWFTGSCRLLGDRERYLDRGVEGIGERLGQ